MDVRAEYHTVRLMLQLTLGLILLYCQPIGSTHSNMFNRTSQLADDLIQDHTRACDLHPDAGRFFCRDLSISHDWPDEEAVRYIFGDPPAAAVPKFHLMYVGLNRAILPCHGQRYPNSGTAIGFQIDAPDGTCDIRNHEENGLIQRRGEIFAVGEGLDESTGITFQKTRGLGFVCMNITDCTLTAKPNLELSVTCMYPNGGSFFCDETKITHTWPLLQAIEFVFGGTTVTGGVAERFHVGNDQTKPKCQGSISEVNDEQVFNIEILLAEDSCDIETFINSDDFTVYRKGRLFVTVSGTDTAGERVRRMKGLEFICGAPFDCRMTVVPDPADPATTAAPVSPPVTPVPPATPPVTLAPPPTPPVTSAPPVTPPATSPVTTGVPTLEPSPEPTDVTLDDLLVPFTLPLKIATRQEVRAIFGNSKDVVIHVITVSLEEQHRPDYAIMGKRCWATASENAESEPFYEFLGRNSCISDPENAVELTEGTHKLIYEVALYALTENEESPIYVQCDVNICRKTGDRTRCTKSCGTGTGGTVGTTVVTTTANPNEPTAATTPTSQPTEEKLDDLSQTFAIPLSVSTRQEFRKTFLNSKDTMIHVITVTIKEKLDRLIYDIMGIRCWATPTPDLQSTPFFEFLGNGGCVDSTVAVVKREGFDKWIYEVELYSLNEDDEEAPIFVHCDFNVCRKRGDRRRCTKICSGTTLPPSTGSTTLVPVITPEPDVMLEDLTQTTNIPLKVSMRQEQRAIFGNSLNVLVHVMTVALRAEHSANYAIAGRRCWTTPTANPASMPIYEFLGNGGCIVDPGNAFEIREGTHKLIYEMELYSLTDDDDAAIYVHCDIDVCRKKGDRTRCIRTCPGTGTGETVPTVGTTVDPSVPAEERLEDLTSSFVIPISMVGRKEIRSVFGNSKDALLHVMTVSLDTSLLQSSYDLLGDSCWITADPDPNSRPYYPFVKSQGCPAATADEVAIRTGTPNKLIYEVASGFSFDESGEELEEEVPIYFHCDIHVCRRTGDADRTRCRPACSDSSPSQLSKHNSSLASQRISRRLRI